MSDREIYNKLIKLKSLKPSKKVNELFSKLVNFVLNRKNSLTLNNYEISKIQEICSVAESEMEFYWANKIIKSKKPKEMLMKFWYYDNYLKLAELEWKTLENCTIHSVHGKSIFIGSGPLPLTAIILAEKYKVHFTLVDIDSKALEVSKQLIYKLGLENFFDFSNETIENINFTSFDIVFFAALVGGNDKEKITNQVVLKMKKNSHLLCRSVYDNRVLLYKEINLQKISSNLICEIRTYDEVVNSILIFKK